MYFDVPNNSLRYKSILNKALKIYSDMTKVVQFARLRRRHVLFHTPYSFVTPIKQSKTEIELASGITHDLLSRPSIVFISEESL